MNQEKLKQYGDRAMALDSDGKVMQKVSASVEGSKIIQPVDIQTRYQQTIQTHNAVSVGATSYSIGSWIDCNGFDTIGLTLLNGGSTNNSLGIQWSNDGVNVQGDEVVLATSTSPQRAGNTVVKSRYCRVYTYNGHTASVTMSAWAYLKA